MNNFTHSFFKGMGSISLFPQIPDHEEMARVSPWQGVADAFARTGHNMKSAMEQLDAQLREQPTRKDTEQQG
jgi:hypothetical protein